MAAISFFLLLVSCNPSKRINRIVKKHPELMVSDTLTIYDTVFIQSVTYDTTTRLIENKTIEVINNERVRLVYNYDTLTREIWHQVECKADTVVQLVRVPVQKIQPVTVQSPRKWFDWLAYGLAVGFILFVAFRLYQ